MAVSTNLAVPWPLYIWSLVTPKHTERSALCLKDKMLQQYHATCHYQVEWFLWTIEHTNRSLDNSNATFRPSRASSGIQYNKSKGGNLYTCAKGNDWSILCTSNDWSILCTSTQC